MKRYSIDLSDAEESEMEDDKNGEWCLYEIAQAEIDAAESALHLAGNLISNQEAEIERLQAEIDELKSDFIRLHKMAVKWVDKDHHDWQELMKLRWGD